MGGQHTVDGLRPTWQPAIIIYFTLLSTMYICSLANKIVVVLLWKGVFMQHRFSHGATSLTADSNSSLKYQELILLRRNCSCSQWTYN